MKLYRDHTGQLVLDGKGCTTVVMPYSMNPNEWISKRINLTESVKVVGFKIGTRDALALANASICPDCGVDPNAKRDFRDLEAYPEDTVPAPMPEVTIGSTTNIDYEPLTDITATQSDYTGVPDRLRPPAGYEWPVVNRNNVDRHRHRSPYTSGTMTYREFVESLHEDDENQTRNQIDGNLIEEDQEGSDPSQ